MYQWGATSLITCAKFQVNERLVLDYALDVAKIVITREIQQETVNAGLAGGYPDAVAIKERIDAGRIEVCTVTQMPTPLEEVLDLYSLQDGDKAVVRLSLQSEDVDAAEPMIGYSTWCFVAAGVTSCSFRTSSKNLSPLVPTTLSLDSNCCW